MKPFLHGKNQPSLVSLRPPPGFTAPSAAGGARHAHAAANAGSVPGASSATVELVKEGDKIVRLVITCVCGERVEVECLYPPGT